VVALVVSSLLLMRQPKLVAGVSIQLCTSLTMPALPLTAELHTTGELTAMPAVFA
jgi:hypothetical protein